MFLFKRAHLLNVVVLLSLNGVIAMVPPPFVVINMDVPPAVRWVDAVSIALATHPWEHSFGPVFKHHNESLFWNVSDTNMVTFGKTVERHWPEQAAELRGMSAAFADLGHYVSYEYLCAWVYFHEIAHTSDSQYQFTPTGCTALLVQDKKGAVVHGRNMDQSPREARNLTLELSFTRGGKEVFRAVDWYWITTGVMTAMKTGVASVQENWRFQSLSLDSVMADIQRGVLPQVFFFRQALMTATSFKEVVTFCEVTRLAAPFYVAVAGPQPGEGVIITRSIARTNPTLTLNASTWFLVQTNYDHWMPDPADDPRRTVATEKVMELGQEEASLDVGAFAVLSAYPVHNPDTAYSAVLRSATGEMFAVVRDPLVPAPPQA